MQNTVVPAWPSDTSAVLAGMCSHTALTVAEQFQAVGYEWEAPPGQTDGQKLLGLGGGATLTVGYVGSSVTVCHS